MQIKFRKFLSNAIDTHFDYLKSQREFNSDNLVLFRGISKAQYFLTGKISFLDLVNEGKISFVQLNEFYERQNNKLQKVTESFLNLLAHTLERYDEFFGQKNPEIMNFITGNNEFLNVSSQF